MASFIADFQAFLSPTELSSEKHGWHTYNYAETFDLSFSTVKDNVERIDATKLSTDEFITRYESTYTPVVLTNAQNDWPANYKWTLEVSFECHDCFENL